MRTKSEITGLICLAAAVCVGTTALASAAGKGENLKGGRLIYAEPILPDTYDPITTSDNETSLRLSELMFESLVYIDYRGEVKVILVNLGREPYEGAPGDRIAQLLLVPCLTPEVRTVEELPPSHDGRGEAGFGSSGR